MLWILILLGSCGPAVIELEGSNPILEGDTDVDTDTDTDTDTDADADSDADSDSDSDTDTGDPPAHIDYDGDAVVSIDWGWGDPDLCIGTFTVTVDPSGAVEGVAGCETESSWEDFTAEGPLTATVVEGNVTGTWEYRAWNDLETADLTGTVTAARIDLAVHGESRQWTLDGDWTGTP